LTHYDLIMPLDNMFSFLRGNGVDDIFVQYRCGLQLEHTELCTQWLFKP